MSVYLPRNARTLMRAQQLEGTIKYLSQGEIDARNQGYSPYSTETWVGLDIGRVWPAVGICSPGPMTRGHALPGAERFEGFAFPALREPAPTAPQWVLKIA
jgi:hypothetical protein